MIWRCLTSQMRKHFAGGSVCSASSQPLSSYEFMIFMRLYVLYYPMTHFEVMVYFAFPTMFANSVAHCFVEEIRRICDRVLAWSHRFPQFHMHRNVAKNVQSIPVLCELFPGPANYFDDPYHVSRLVLTSEILHCLLHRHGHHQLGR